MGRQSFAKELVLRFPHPEFAGVLREAPEGFALFSRTAEQPGSGGSSFAEPRRVLAMVHPSWFEEMLLSAPPQLRPSLRRALADGVMAAPLKEFLLAYLVRRWPERAMPGLEEIEPTSLSWLLECDSAVLEKLVGLLSAYDCVDELRRVIDKKRLYSFMAKFSPLEQKFLRALLYDPEATSLGEKVRFLGDYAEVIAAMKKKAFENFAALVRQLPNLLFWHFVHRQDRKFGALFLQCPAPEAPVGDSERVHQQVIHAYQFLQRMEPS